MTKIKKNGVKSKKVQKNLKIDVGCGPKKKQGFIGVDLFDLPGVDYVVNLDTERLPFADGSVSEIYSSHCLEHLENPGSILAEFSRVLEVGGTAHIIVPHYSNPYAYHFTHKSFWSSYSLEQQYINYYVRSELRLQSFKIRIVCLPFLDPVLSSLATRFRGLYERFFNSFVKAWEVHFFLEKVEYVSNETLQ